MAGPIVTTENCVSRSIVNKPIVRASTAVLGLLVLSGCSTMGNIGSRISEKTTAVTSSMFSKSQTQHFSSRVYAGGSAGATRLSPETSGTRFTISDREGTATQLRLGVDVNSLLSVELDTSVLGSASVREVEADVSYTSLTASTLFYVLGDPGNRARRIGWQGYGRLGYSLVQKASVVQPFDESGSNLLLGIGAEYGFRNGFGFRGEVSRFDSDATLFGLGLVYRFGMSARQVGAVVASVAKDSIPGTTSEPSLGSASPVTGHVSLVHEGPYAALWSQPKRDGDSDGDGVLNEDDSCRKTKRNTAVGQNGCGLFDAVLAGVTFKPGTSWLSPTARQEIDEVVSVLLAFPEARIEVQAHADNRGPEEINDIVSAARAEKVADYMIKQGVGEQQLVAKGYGESRPLATNDTAEGRSQNRRVQLVTLPSLTPEQITNQSYTTGASSTGSSAMAAKVKKSKLNATMKGGDIKALAAIAEGMDRPIGSNNVDGSNASTEPSLGAALPVSIGDTALAPAVRVSRLGLGGPMPAVKFKPGTTELMPSAKTALSKVSDQLEAHPKVRLALLVYVSEPSDSVSNLALSRDQANTLVEYLESEGVDRRRLVTEPYGDVLPLAQTVTESDRNRNRRVEIRVINDSGR